MRVLSQPNSQVSNAICKMVVVAAFAFIAWVILAF